MVHASWTVKFPLPGPNLTGRQKCQNFTQKFSPTLEDRDPIHSIDLGPDVTATTEPDSPRSSDYDGLDNSGTFLSLVIFSFLCLFL